MARQMLSPGIVQQPSELHCIACAAIVTKPNQSFRCPSCGDLLQIAYPGWKQSAPNAESLRALWRSRRASLAAIDQSGVWRFRELLPGIPEQEVITLREGNTPLYHLPNCAQAAGIDHLLAKHQGMNPTGSFKDTGMTVAASVARAEGFRWVG